jgi:hypothetical protein
MRTKGLENLKQDLKFLYSFERSLKYEKVEYYFHRRYYVSCSKPLFSEF